MKLNDEWVTGFVDGEGTFYIGINKHPSMQIGYQVLPEFRIVQHKRDIQLLHALKNFFGAGVVRVNHDDRYELRIRKLEVLREMVIPFFEKHPLQTQKKFDFQKFKKVLNIMTQEKHRTQEGLIEIINISSQMNRADKRKALAIKDQIVKDKDKVHTL